MDYTRRNFVKWTAGAAAWPLLGACRSTQGIPANEPGTYDLNAERLEETADAPVLRREQFDRPIMIEAIDLLKLDEDYVVHVRSREGAEGISVTNSRATYLYPIVKTLVIPYFIGKDARDLEAHLFGIYRYRSNYKLQGIALWCPVAWVEMAILDMLGRIAGKSIGQLLGDPVRDEVPFYVASGRRDSTAVEEAQYLLKLVEDTGAKAVKFRVGGRMSRNADALPGRTEQLIPLSRKTLGDNIAIHADANSSYDPPKAIEIGRMLEDIDAVYFEEPCPFDHLEETKRVTDALTIPVAGGEQEYSQWRFQWAILNRVVDIVQPDLQYYGGLIRSTRVARMAALANMSTTVHISGGFGFVYVLHFASYTPDIGAYQEYKTGIEKYARWFDPALQIRDGAITIPQGPGVGITNIKGLLQAARPFG